MTHYNQDVAAAMFKSNNHSQDVPPPIHQPNRNNKYSINKDLIRMCNQRIRMPFKTMQSGDTFWIVGHEVIATEFHEQQTIWHATLDEPTVSLEDKCLMPLNEHMFYQGAGTTWMDNIPRDILNKLHNHQYCFEIEFIDISPKGCFRLKPTGRQIDYNAMH